MNCNHVAEIQLTEKALKEYGEHLMFPGPGLVLTKVEFVYSPFEFCPWCGEKIERTHGP